MSCTLYLETERTPSDRTTFDFIWSVSGDEWNITESIQTFPADDRLMASIINLGKALRCLADNKAAHATIEIKSDIDGLDFRHGKEHDILFALVNPKDDFEAMKLRSLYHSYNKYLGRIKQLQGVWDITIKLVA